MEDQTFNLIEKLYIRMEDGFSIMNQRFEQIDRRFEQIDQRFEQVDQQLKEVRQDIVRIEHDHGEKLKALFDGYQAHTEAIDRLTGEVGDLKKKVEKHEVKLKIVK